MARGLSLLIALSCTAVLAPGQVSDELPASQPAPGASGTEALTNTERLEKARALFESGSEEDLIAAQQYLQDVLRVDPTNVEANLIIGEVALERGDGEFARSRFRDILAIEKNNFRANRGLGEVYYRSRMWRQSITYLEIAAKVAPPDKRAETLSVLARCYVQDGNAAKALDTAREAVAADPKNVEALQTLVAVRTKQGNFDQALEESRRLIELIEQSMREKPGDIKLARRGSLVYQTVFEMLSLYHNTLHIPNARGMPTTDPIPGKERDIAQVLMRIGEARSRQVELETRITFNRGVLPYYEKALKLDDKSVAALVGYARALFTVDRIDDAAEQCRKALEIDPDNVDARQLLERLTSAGHEPAAAAAPSSGARP